MPYEACTDALLRYTITDAPYASHPDLQASNLYPVFRDQHTGVCGTLAHPAKYIGQDPTTPLAFQTVNYPILRVVAPYPWTA